MPLQDMVELPRVVQRRADLVTTRFSRAEALDVTADRIKRLFQHTMIAVEQVDRPRKLRITQLEARKIMIVLDVMMRMRVAEQMPAEMAHLVHQESALHLAGAHVRKLLESLGKSTGLREQRAMHPLPERSRARVIHMRGPLAGRDREQKLAQIGAQAFARFDVIVLGLIIVEAENGFVRHAAM